MTDYRSLVLDWLDAYVCGGDAYAKCAQATIEALRGEKVTPAQPSAEIVANLREQIGVLIAQRDEARRAAIPVTAGAPVTITAEARIKPVAEKRTRNPTDAEFAERCARVREILAADPKRSDTSISREVSCGEVTVSRIRKELGIPPLLNGRKVGASNLAAYNARRKAEREAAQNQTEAIPEPDHSPANGHAPATPEPVEEALYGTRGYRDLTDAMRGAQGIVAQAISKPGWSGGQLAMRISRECGLSLDTAHEIIDKAVAARSARTLSTSPRAALSAVGE